MCIRFFGTLCIYKRNYEARSRNHFPRQKSIGITYSELVFVALFIQQLKRMRHIVIYGSSGSTVCFRHTS